MRGRAPGDNNLLEPSAEAELRRRYATGEIDEDEYAERLTMLRNR